MIQKLVDREDKIKQYLSSEIKNLLYDELSEEFCKNNGMSFLIGVPLPFLPKDLVSFSENGLQVTNIADNVVLSLGVDPQFKYAESYRMFLAKFFDEGLLGVILGKGTEELKAKKYRRAAIYFRAALVLEPEDKDALFGYAAGLREWYLDLEGDESRLDMLGNLKDEANQFFEFCTEADPSFAPAWYYVGYTYLNQALYAKANAAWNIFLQLMKDDDGEVVQEIRDRVAQLVEPVKIEAGINKIIAGKYEEGLKILEPYVDGDYNNWWPLHYYLACAYRELECIPEAIEGFKRVIEIAPSNYEANKSLGELYDIAGEEELSEKYLRKAELLNKEE